MTAAVNHDPLRVVPVDSWRARRAFLRLPWRVYADDPAWVAPLLVERGEFINRRKHPFYLHGDAAMFLAWRGGVAVGRVLVADDPRYNAQHGTNVGTFGMFECLDDVEAAGGLLDAGAEWLIRRGRTGVMGPIDYSTNYACGLLIDGFETPPRVLMNHQRPYYAGLLESWGLVKARDLYCWWADEFTDEARQWVERALPLLERADVTVRPVRLDDWQAEMQRCKAVYHEAWQNNWGFVTMTDAEFAHYARDLRRIGVPELMLLAEVGGKPVGFSLALPDINEALRPLNGRLTRWGVPWGLWQLRRGLKRISTVRQAVLGVTPAYRGRGVAESMVVRTLEYGMNRAGYKGVEMSWVLEENQRLSRPLERLGFRRYKTYRIYEKALGEEGA